MIGRLVSFHRQLYRRLQAARSSENATCLVDPDYPQRSLLDRTFRSGMLAFYMIFMIVFGTIGLIALAYFVPPGEPRDIEGRIQIDSTNRSSRCSAQLMILYHGLILMIAVPVAVICFASGDLYALTPLVLSTVPIAIVFMCWRYVVWTQPVTGKLLLPGDCTQGENAATLLLPASWQGPVDLESRWLIPPPPSNRIGVEDETGATSHVQLPAVSGTTQTTEIDFPIPELPEPPPEDRAIKLSLIGTIGGRQFKDEFSIGDEARQSLRPKERLGRSND
jgi:hypothetical protein